MAAALHQMTAAAAFAVASHPATLAGHLQLASLLLLLLPGSC
jgi:hypothetical protein